jgi:hypothetical protein
VPASAEYGVPGADDEAMFADIVRSLGRDKSAVRNALAMLREIAGGDFTELDETKAETAAMTLLGREAGDDRARTRRAAVLLPRRSLVPRTGHRRRAIRKAGCWSRVIGRCSTRSAVGPAYGATLTARDGDVAVHANPDTAR